MNWSSRDDLPARASPRSFAAVSPQAPERRDALPEADGLRRHARPGQVALAPYASPAEDRAAAARFPWPLPCAIGLAAGIGMREAGLAPWWLLALPTLVLPARLLLLRTGHLTDPGRPLAVPPAQVLHFVLPLLLVVVGYARLAMWQSIPDPLAGSYGERMTLVGSSDGEVFSAREPVRAKLAVSPRGSLPPGRYRLQGTISMPEGRRNPGGFDYRDYLLRRGIHGQLRVAEVTVSSPVTPLRDRLRAGVSARLSGGSAALMEAMALGVRDGLGELRETFSAAGLAHILALSGLHVGVLVAAVGALLTPLGLARYPALIAFVLGFVVMVGATPSVVRAGLMAVVVLLGLWQGSGRVEPWPALGLAALVTLLLRPAWLVDISFALSYGAVAGILLFALPLLGQLGATGRRPWHPRVWLAGSVLTSVSAQSLTLPLVAASFGTVPLFAPLVNVVALPLATLLVPLGFAAGTLGLVSPGLSGAVNVVAGPLADALIGLAELGRRLPAVHWGEVSTSGACYFVAAAAAIALAVNRLLRLRRALAVAAVASLLSAATPAPHPPPELVAIDVGQGDSFLLRLPGRIEVLVDGGGSPFGSFDVGSGIVVPTLAALGVDELELVVATHDDLDHMEGLITVVRSLPVGMLLLGGATGGEASETRALLRAAAGKGGVEIRTVTRGQIIHLGGARLEVLNPPPQSYGSSNDDSVALLVTIPGGKRVLLAGDVSERVERDLAVPDVDVLIAPHHGSRSSSSPELLAAALPEEVIVSVGVNRYGHPDPRVLARFRSLGATVHVTRDAGAVRIALR